MGRKHQHEDHVNHEAWAIPYGDLVTLLLAFFVVMYAISSVNEGKYRVLADSISEAFGGPPRTLSPMLIGEPAPTAGSTASGPPRHQPAHRGAMAVIAAGGWPQPVSGVPQLRPMANTSAAIDHAAIARAEAQLGEISERVVEALQPLIDLELVKVRLSDLWLEIEIRSDLLFASGVAVPSTDTRSVLESLAEALYEFPNPLRIEGHTDNVPIATAMFPSNWELSAARASSVARLFEAGGIHPPRLAVVGFGETRPLQANVAPEGRNANRRVVIVVLAMPDDELGRFHDSMTGREHGTDAAPSGAADVYADGDSTPLEAVGSPGERDALAAHGAG